MRTSLGELPFPVDFCTKISSQINGLPFFTFICLIFHKPNESVVQLTRFFWIRHTETGFHRVFCTGLCSNETRANESGRERSNVRTLDTVEWQRQEQSQRIAAAKPTQCTLQKQKHVRTCKQWCSGLRYLNHWLLLNCLLWCGEISFFTGHRAKTPEIWLLDNCIWAGIVAIQ